jgi:hypothetical protein
MAWTASNISTAAMCCILNGNAAISDTGTPGPFYAASSTQSFSGDTVNCALYNNSVTTATASTDTLAHNAYLAAGGQWVAANELSTGGGYTVGGVAVTPKAETFAGTNVAKFTSSGTPQWTTASFSAYGALVYDNTITNKYVYCWNYFGGVQTVTSGTFTINWNASGIFAITCT